MSDEFGARVSTFISVIAALVAATSAAFGFYYSNRVNETSRERSVAAQAEQHESQKVIEGLRRKVSESDAAIRKQQQESERLRGRIFGSAIER